MNNDNQSKESQLPVLNCVVIYRGKILLVQRSENAKLYPGAWNGISAFLDEPTVSVEERARMELREELGISESEIVAVREGEAFEQEDSEFGKTRIVHPVFVEVSTDEVTLDRDEQDFAWVDAEEARQYELVPDFDKVLDAFSL